MRSAHTIVAIVAAAMLLTAASPVMACSIVWSGYERITAESDAVVIVEVTSVSGLSAYEEGDNPFVPSSVGVAKGTVERSLRGRDIPTSMAFDYWRFDDEARCGVSFEVEVGQRYYVWLRQMPDGSRKTYFGVNATDVSSADARAIRRYARSSR